MRTKNRMQEVTDNAGWSFSTMVFGVVVASRWPAQLATSVFTLVICMVVAHFVKLFLNHYVPDLHFLRRRKQEKAE